MKVGDRVRTSDGLEGFLVDRSLLNTRQWWVTIGRYTGRYDEDTLIPVEPERVRTAVQAYLCTNRECGWNDGGVCGSIWWRNNGCDLRVLPQVPSPGLLQRMGMVMWPSEDDWVCVKGKVFPHWTEERALRYVRDNPDYRAFKWWDPEECAREAGYDEGYAAGESERDALRAEVERYKRAVDVLSDYFCPPIGSARCEQFCEKYSDCNDCMVEWALSEAGK